MLLMPWLWWTLRWPATNWVPTMSNHLPIPLYKNNFGVLWHIFFAKLIDRKTKAFEQWKRFKLASTAELNSTVFSSTDSRSLGKRNFLNRNPRVRNWNNIGIKCNESALNHNIIENVIKANLNSFTPRVKSFYLNSFVPLMVSLLFLRTKNRRSIFRLFSPLVWTPSESAMAMRNISDHGTDMVRKRNITEATEQNCSFLPRGKFYRTAWYQKRGHIQED